MMHVLRKETHHKLTLIISYNFKIFPSLKLVMGFLYFLTFFFFTSLIPLVKSCMFGSELISKAHLWLFL